MKTMRQVDVRLPFAMWDARSIIRDAVAIMILPFIVAAFYAFAILEQLYEVLNFILLIHLPSLPPDKMKQLGKLSVDVFDPDRLGPAEWTDLQRNYIAKCVPFVLRRKDGAPLTDAAPPEEAVSAAFRQGCIRVVSASYFHNFGTVDHCIGKLFPRRPRAYWPLWFLGKYSQGKAHVDLGPATYNCYYLKSGGKDVIIAPPEVTRKVALQPGIDGIFITDSEDERREYLKSLPYYYQIDMQPHSLLVFSNSACIHQFRNIDSPDASPPEALSIRMAHPTFGDRRVRWHLMTDVRMYWRFTTYAAALFLREKAEDRKAAYI
ncbi:hypothetical protein AB1Y20_009757 [Prymnesium parvum]|uniref:Uncharacterized protein n=1 Tax=Prymnesium parvum TaxID=97485 RepID=A0AB34K1S7_PRYPA|mmetsp:Transcript_32085/g.77891  ORF Transcript_32085/g.77891 Transcript_32085/m.77891 type:complete len:320 (+) Transcript_32085:74-1033(+)